MGKVIRETIGDFRRQEWAIKALLRDWTEISDFDGTGHRYSAHTRPALDPIDYTVFTHFGGRRWLSDFVEVKGCNKAPSAMLPVYLSEAKAVALGAEANAHDAGAWVVWAFTDHIRWLSLEDVMTHGEYTRFGRNDRGVDEFEYGYRVPYIATVGPVSYA